LALSILTMVYWTAFRQPCIYSVHLLHIR